MQEEEPVSHSKKGQGGRGGKGKPQGGGGGGRGAGKPAMPAAAPGKTEECKQQ